VVAGFFAFGSPIGSHTAEIRNHEGGAASPDAHERRI
jgi:hypothetical protein